MIDLNELELLAKKATSGPWSNGGFLTNEMSPSDYLSLMLKETQNPIPHFMTVWQDSTEKTTAMVGNGPTAYQNSEFIAAANPSVIIELIDRLIAAESERDELKAKLAEIEAQEPVAFHSGGHTVIAGTKYFDMTLNRKLKELPRCNLYAQPIANNSEPVQASEPVVPKWLYEGAKQYLSGDVIAIPKTIKTEEDFWDWLQQDQVAPNKAEVPEGWKLVPKILTSKMYDEIVKAANRQDFISWPANCWENALDVAPLPPLKDGE